MQKEELGFYLEMRTSELMSEGLNVDETKRKAVNSFGDSQRVEEECVQIEKLEIRRRQRNHMLDSLRRDTRFAINSFLRQPFFSGLIILMLALGIAGNTAVFSIINALFIRPFPYENSERLVDLDTTAPEWNLDYVGITYPDFLAWREGNRSFDSMGIFTSGDANMTSDEGARRLKIIKSSYDMLETLRLQPLIGRAFTREDETLGQPNVALLISGFWHEHFGGAADVIGRTITLGGELFEIIGVLPAEAVIFSEAQLWIPFRADPTSRTSFFLSGIGRMAGGVSIEQAETDLRSIQQGLVDNNEAAAAAMPIVTDLRKRRLGDLRTGSFAVWGAVAILLLIACTNIASLMLAKSSVRQREFGIRAAIGAGRGSIIRQFLTESMILALAGGLLGFLLGLWSIEAINTVFPIDLPQWATLYPDFNVMLFSFSVCVGSAILFGLLPALRSTKGRVAELLTEGMGRTSTGRSTKRLMRAFVSVEIALSLGLLVVASLLIQTYRNISRIDAGFDPEGILAFRLDLPEADYPERSDILSFQRTLLERLEALPGVESAATTSVIPMRGHSGYFFEAEGAQPREEGQPNPVTLVRFVSIGYIETAGLQLKSGRFLTVQDTMAVVVNETFAHHYWGEEDPVGRRIRPPGSQDPWFEVVGLAYDVKHYGLDEEMIPGVYARIVLSSARDAFFIIRTGLEPSSLASAVRNTVETLSSSLPVFGMETMREIIDDDQSFRRATSVLLGIFALVSLILTLGGVYGVISYVVSQRTREIGIRIALGAGRRDVIGMVLRQGAWMVLTGCLAGIGLVILTSKALASLMFGIGSADALTIAGVTILLILISLPANLIPALRASGVDPVTALRIE